MPLWMKFNNMESNSPLMDQLTLFHDLSMMIIMMILTTTFLISVLTIKNKLTMYKPIYSQWIEILWTILPSTVLLIIAIPSMKIMYLMDEIHLTPLTIKTIGHQWYWTYEYSNSNQNEMESYMKKNNNFNFRLINTDNHIVMPMLTKMRMLISSTDVLHSWTIPNLGIKMDAVPGRLNQVSMMIHKPGMFTGQCSEICGTNHSFMPITMESVNMKSFMKWLKY